MTADRATARKLARQALARGDAVGWFEDLYTQSDRDAKVVPWADLAVNPNVQDWLDRAGALGNVKQGLVVGCGLGDDAEALASLGWRVVAFDVAPTAIRWCRQRFPQSRVEYVAADLLAPPERWRAAFDFVLEAYTLQVLPASLYDRAVAAIASFVAPGGTLLVITRGRDANEPGGEMPWPLTRADLDRFKDHGLAERTFEDYLDGEQPPVRRFRVQYRREI